MTVYEHRSLSVLYVSVITIGFAMAWPVALFIMLSLIFEAYMRKEKQ